MKPKSRYVGNKRCDGRREKEESVGGRESDRPRQMVGLGSMLLKDAKGSWLI
jgi:hypothetical protein